MYDTHAHHYSLWICLLVVPCECYWCASDAHSIWFTSDAYRKWIATSFICERTLCSCQLDLSLCDLTDFDYLQALTRLWKAHESQHKINSGPAWMKWVGDLCMLAVNISKADVLGSEQWLWGMQQKLNASWWWSATPGIVCSLYSCCRYAMASNGALSLPEGYHSGLFLRSTGITCHNWLTWLLNLLLIFVRALLSAVTQLK